MEFVFAERIGDVPAAAFPVMGERLRSRKAT
jgi:hypothetical protein